VSLGLIAAGCGGSSDEKTSSSSPPAGAPAGDARAVLASIKPAAQQGPQKIGLNIAVDLDGTLSDPTVGALLGDGPIKVDLSGPVDAAGKAADLKFALTAGKINLDGGLRLTGDKVFLQLKDKWYALPADALASATTAGNAQNIDPAKILAALGDPSDLIDNATVLGAEDIEGIATDHVGGAVDTAALVKAIARVAEAVGNNTGPIDSKQIADATGQLEKFVKDAKVELWVGREDKQLHRLKLDLKAVLDAATKASSGLDGFGMIMSVTSTPAESPKVEAPANAGTMEQLQADIGPIILSGLGGATP
jgi:hypothetical protein